MIEFLIIVLVLIGYLFYKEHKNSQTIREILASKFSQETFEKVIVPEEKKEDELMIEQEELLDNIDAEELVEKLSGVNKE
jgi:hypothetical protein